MSNKSTTNKGIGDKECFVIMPISDVDSHPLGHFLNVYENIIRPACKNAGFTAKRADEEKASHLIQVPILKKLIESPIVVCDLSTRNPNVLFELGIRQAFNKPVVLIREIGTPDIFDISSIRYLEYSKEMSYQDVVNAQERLTSAIIETLNEAENSNNFNSIINLLSLKSPAKISNTNISSERMLFNIIHAEIISIHKELKGLKEIFYSQLMPACSKQNFELPIGMNSINGLAIILEQFTGRYISLKTYDNLDEYIEKLNGLKELLIEIMEIKNNTLSLGELEADFDRLIKQVKNEIENCDI